MSSKSSPSTAPEPVLSLPSIPPGTRVSTLDNGLTIILREDHSAPVVSAQAWCRAGSIDEGRWLGAGLSHVLEHMLFKGTTTRHAGRIDQEIQDAGGYMNAYTSFDRTVYWINVPNTGVRVALDILTDIMQHATLPEEELAREMDVIRREMDMNQDDPGQKSARRLFEIAYTRSPYRCTIIGYPDIFNELKREDIVGYYREKYAPNNIFFVVVGDLRADDVEQQIRAGFAGAKARPIPPTVLPVEPRQTAAREMIEEAPIEMGHLHFSWHIPGVRHPDVPFLDLLATLLGGGRSSRLYRRVREELALVNSVDAWTYSPGDPGLFGLSAMFDADRFTAVREAMLVELEGVREHPVSSAELAKAVKQFTAGILSSRKTMQGQAQDLGANWLAAGDLNFSERYLAAVKRATPADLLRVAREHLPPENRTLYALLPKGTSPAGAVAAEHHADQAIQKFELANGLRLLVKEDHRLPFVEFRAVFQGGVLAETAGNNGITLLMSKMLLQGTVTRNAEQIAREIESVGGSLDTYAGNNSFGLNAEVLSADFATGLDLVTDVLLHPAFPPEALEREREIQLNNLQAQKDDLLARASRLMRETMFGPSGYGLQPIGTEESVRDIQTADLREFHARLAVPDNGVMAVYGDVDTSVVRAALEAKAGAWSRGATPRHEWRPAFPRPPVQHVAESRDKKQAVLFIGFPGTTLFDPDRYALELLQEACSDLGSRLFLRIRDKLGLAYYVGAQNFLGLVPGYFAFYCGTEPSKAALVETELLQEAEMLRREGLTGEELNRAKAKIIGQKKIARQDLGGFAMNTALDELYGLGYDNYDSENTRYEAVTLDQVKMAAQKHLRPDAVVVATVRPGNHVADSPGGK